MFDSLPFTLADAATQPAADEVPYKPNAPVVGSASEQTGSTATATHGTTGTASTAPLGSPPPPSGSLFGSLQPLVLMVGIIAIMFWIMGASQRKEKKKRASMLSALKKGDKVQTIGGVIASVVEVRENDVVLKVDDSGNTRIRFTRGAIQHVIDDKPVEGEQKL